MNFFNEKLKIDFYAQEEPTHVWFILLSTVIIVSIIIILHAISKGWLRYFSEYSVLNPGDPGCWHLWGFPRSQVIKHQGSRTSITYQSCMKCGFTTQTSKRSIDPNYKPKPKL